MATPMTAAQWRTALAAEGVRVVYESGWTTFGRDDETGKPFGPVYGVVIHHTAGRSDLHVITGGTPTLPPPLAHAWLGRSGATPLHQVSIHRANHAGTVPHNVLTAMKAESGHPRPDAAEPLDGNDFTYGLEIENRGDGSDPYPPDQYDQAVRWAAAVCRHHGWSAASCFGHKEITRRKVDPSFSMNAFRAKVSERLRHHPSWSPSDPTPEEPPMAEPSAYVDVLRTDAIPSPRNYANHAGNPTWAGESYLRFVAETLIDVKAQLDRIEAAQSGTGS